MTAVLAVAVGPAERPHVDCGGGRPHARRGHRVDAGAPPQRHRRGRRELRQHQAERQLHGGRGRRTMRRTAGHSACCRCASQTVRQNAARSGKAGSRTDLPPASRAPSANSGWAPAAASAVNCSVTPRPHSSTASTAPCAKALCAAPGSARPNTGSMRAPSRWMPSNAARSKLPGLAAATRARPFGCQYASAGRQRCPGWRRPSPAPSGQRRTARGGRPTIQASAAWPGTSSTVCPSGAPRASNWLAPVTPSALPTSTRRIAVSGGSDCSSAGNRASAQRLSAPSAGPATSSLGVSANGAATAEAARQRIAAPPASRRAGWSALPEGAPAVSRQVGHPGPPPKGTLLP